MKRIDSAPHPVKPFQEDRDRKYSHGTGIFPEMTRPASMWPEDHQCVRPQHGRAEKTDESARLPCISPNPYIGLRLALNRKPYYAHLIHTMEKLLCP